MPQAEPVQKKPKLDFDQAYLDTNILVASNWPSLSVTLENLLVLAGWCKVSVIIPDPVRIEARAHWLRELRSKVSVLDVAVSQFKRLTRSVEGQVTAQPESEGALLSRYDEAEAKVMKAFNVGHCGMTTRGVSEIFVLACEYVLPFEDDKKKGKGFQDAVILSSVLEHLASNPKHSAVLLTNDDALARAKTSRFMPVAKDVRFRAMKFDEAEEILLDAYQEMHITQPLKQERENALAAAKTKEPELRAFLAAHLKEIPLTEFIGGVRGTLREIGGLKSLELMYVQTPVPDPAKPDRSVRVAIAVSAKVLVDVESSKTFSALLRLQELSTGSAVADEVSWFGGIEATANVRNREFEDLKPISLVSIEEIGKGKWV